TNWVNYNTGNSPLPSDHVRALGEDPSGPIWVGTTSGLAKLADTTWTIFDFMAMGGESNHVSAISTYGTDSLWVGLINGGLLNLRSATLTYFTLANSGINDNTILGIARDSGADLWMAAPASAAIYYHNLAFFNYNNFNSGNPSLSMNAVALDGNEKPWFSSFDRGVVHFDGQNWQHYVPANSAVPDQYLHAIAYDSGRGLIWGGTATQGLFSLNPAVITATDPLWQSDLQVYPNPATDRIKIAGTAYLNGKLTLRDTRGRIVKSAQMQGGADWEMAISLAEGIYFVELDLPAGRKVIQLKVKPAG
ncbi:MAG TPA: T9SS type A sorting domain-containing protein, partial [Bacteroidetes bacterium]|nr:T9SS type A sorting domain-containing protein [Bacteroidota bacterium]